MLNIARIQIMRSKYVKSQVSDIFFLLFGLNDVIESVYEYYGHLGHRALASNELFVRGS